MDLIKQDRVITMLAEAADITLDPQSRVSLYALAAVQARVASNPKLRQIAVWGLVGIGQDEKVDLPTRKSAYVSADQFSGSLLDAKIMARNGLALLESPHPPGRANSGNKSAPDATPGG